MILSQENIKQVVQEYFKDKPVNEVYLFGSYARGEANEDSDVDLIFSFIKDTRISYFGLAKYLVDLEERFLKKVDLVEDKFVFPEIKNEINKEKVLLLAL
ncbi:MAG TPA: nucleotidyltransferase domain-containing protein [Hanamia sp.]|jgi:Predicted nucleotidyltransferases